MDAGRLLSPDCDAHPSRKFIATTELGVSPLMKIHTVARNKWARRCMGATVVVLIATIIVAAIGMRSTLGFVASFVPVTPEVASLQERNPTSTSFMRRHAEGRGMTFDASNPFNVAWTDLGAVSPLLVCSVVKAEDTLFFEHYGFVWDEVGKAAWRYLRGQPGKGGSSITQQLAKNLFLTPERTLQRKLREALITAQIEQVISKARTLEMYVNVIEWGDGVWGVGMASYHYFGKTPAELDAFEAVLLASLVPAPREPLEGWNAERARLHQHRLLDRLYYSGLISATQWQHARSRFDALYSALEAGVSLAGSLRADPTTELSEPPAARHELRPLPLSQAVERACGVERERKENELRRRSEREADKQRGSTVTTRPAQQGVRFAFAQR
jgi:monofunctional glycosyltransferase